MQKDHYWATEGSKLLKTSPPFPSRTSFRKCPASGGASLCCAMTASPSASSRTWSAPMHASVVRILLCAIDTACIYLYGVL